jgi:hypothetical protein
MPSTFTLPQEFFSLASTQTFLGMSSATFIVCSGIQKAFNFQPKWLALIVALALSTWGTFQRLDSQPSDIVVAVVNGFLIYLTALGGSSLGGRLQRPRRSTRSAATRARLNKPKKSDPQAMGEIMAEATDELAEKRGFLTNWLD